MVDKNNIASRVCARVFSAGMRFTGSRQNRLAMVLITVGAKVVRRLGIFLIWLERINENASTKLVKIIARCFLVPVRQFYHFCFYFVLFFQQFMILRLQSEERTLESKNSVV